MAPKKMLEEILKRAELKPQQREMFEDMWDRAHRYKRLSRKQGAVIEKVYFGQKLDRDPAPDTGTPKPKAGAARTGTVKYEGLDVEKRVTNMDQLTLTCPNIKPGSKQHRKIAQFFREGGQVIKVIPA